MNIQEREEMDFNRMSPYEFERAAVQQDGHSRSSQQYLLTDYDTWVPNPFWDGVTVQDFSEAAGEGQYEDEGSTQKGAVMMRHVYPCSCCGGSGADSRDYCTACQECDGDCPADGPFCEECGSAAIVDGMCKFCTQPAAATRPVEPTLPDDGLPF